jgi:hypothetical protein
MGEEGKMYFHRSLSSHLIHNLTLSLLHPWLGKCRKTFHLRSSCLAAEGENLMPFYWKAWYMWHDNCFVCVLPKHSQVTYQFGSADSRNLAWEAQALKQIGIVLLMEKTQGLTSHLPHTKSRFGPIISFFIIRSLNKPIQACHSPLPPLGSCIF